MFNRDKANTEMEAQGRSNKWVGRELDKSPDTIGRYLSGERACPKDTAIAWAVKMGLPAGSFWTEQSSDQLKAG